MLLAALLSTAHAAPTVSGDIQYSPQLKTGIGARIGFPIEMVALRLIPEGGVNVWSQSVGVVPYAGGRVRVLKLLEPGAFAHAQFPLEGGGVGWDAGVSLDLTAIPKLEIGGQLGAIKIGEEASLLVGVHVGLKF